MFPLQRIRNRDINLSRSTFIGDMVWNLGSIESTISRIQLPIPLPNPFIKGISKRLFRLFPHFNIPNKLVWIPRAEQQLELESKSLIDLAQEIKTPNQFLLDLIRPTKNMRIVLLESPYPSQPRQSPAGLIPMQHSKVRQTQREFTVGAGGRVKHETVARTIHRLESEILVVDFESEHVVLVILPVTRGFPEGRVIHVWGLDFLEASGVVFLADEGLEGVVDSHSMGEEEATSW